MSYRRFLAINSCLGFTFDKPPPADKIQDEFWEVRVLHIAWNQHMKDMFRCSWICCLDELISIWISRWTCPGWMFVPRKPHPFGNKYHTIACGMSLITFCFEIVEGKDKPKNKPPRQDEWSWENMWTPTPSLQKPLRHRENCNSWQRIMCTQGHYRTSKSKSLWCSSHQEVKILAKIYS